MLCFVRLPLAAVRVQRREPHVPTDVLDEQCPLHCAPRHLRDQENSNRKAIATRRPEISGALALEVHKIAGFTLRTRRYGNSRLTRQTTTVPEGKDVRGTAQQHSFTELSKAKGLRSHHIYVVSSPTRRISGKARATVADFDTLACATVSMLCPTPTTEGSLLE